MIEGLLSAEALRGVGLQQVRHEMLGAVADADGSGEVRAPTVGRWQQQITNTGSASERC